MGITCEPGEPRNALRDWEPLKIRGELHLHDAGHALQHHPGPRRPLAFVSRGRSALRPFCRACAESGGGRRALEVPVRAAGGAAGPGSRGDSPGTDWQRASDVRGGRRRGCAGGRGLRSRANGLVAEPPWVWILRRALALGPLRLLRPEASRKDTVSDVIKRARVLCNRKVPFKSGFLQLSLFTFAPLRFVLFSEKVGCRSLRLRTRLRGPPPLPPRCLIPFLGPYKLGC